MPTRKRNSYLTAEVFAPTGPLAISSEYVDGFVVEISG